MVILGPHAGWSGGRKGSLAQRRGVTSEDDRSEPEHSDRWFDDLGETGGQLAVGRATPTREFRPDAPEAEIEEASEELLEA